MVLHLWISQHRPFQNLKKKKKKKKKKEKTREENLIHQKKTKKKKRKFGDWGNGFPSNQFHASQPPLIPIAFQQPKMKFI
jgi:hypothetical protein